MKLPRYPGLLLALAFPALGGCGPEETKITPAPAFTTPPDTKPAQPPGRKQTYGASKKYQDAMERRFGNLGK
jgi:hypothetical protein